jgi:hypothetical protein
MAAGVAEHSVALLGREVFREAQHRADLLEYLLEHPAVCFLM